MIPRVIHRIWLGGDMPAEYADYGDTWLKVNEGWELRTWTQKDLPKLENQWLFDACDSLAQRADIARYEIIYRFGGVYVDCGFEARRPLEPLLGDLEFFAGYQGGDVVANGIFGAEPQHPVLRRMIDRLPASALARARRTVADQTGPLPFSEVVHKYGAAHPGALRIFPPQFFFPYSSFELHRTSESFDLAYAVPHFGMSWHRAPGLGASIRGGSLARRPLLAGSAALLRAEDAARAVPARLRSRLKRAALEAARTLRSTGLLPRDPVPVVSLPDRLLLLRTTHGYPLLTRADDLNITPHLVLEGEYEGNAIRFLQDVVKPGDRALDVGANIGLFTVALAHAVGPAGRVFAYECSPELCVLLKRNLVLNAVGEFCDIAQSAAGMTAGTATLRFPASAPGLGSLNEREFPPLDDVVEVEVPIERIDDRVDEMGYLDFVKIDVEGHEVAVLNGMAGLFDRRAVGLLMIEVNHDHHLHDWTEFEQTIVDFVDDRGASLYAVSYAGALEPLALDEVLTNGRYGNLVIDFRPDVDDGAPRRGRTDG